MSDTTYTQVQSDQGQATVGGDKVYTVNGGDWDTVLPPAEGERDRLVVNMGPAPVHPRRAAHDHRARRRDGPVEPSAIGYLRTGIEKNMEFRTWTQGVTFVTRMDYVAGLHNEFGYVLAVEKLLGIEDQIPDFF